MSLLVSNILFHSKNLSVEEVIRLYRAQIEQEYTEEVLKRCPVLRRSRFRLREAISIVEIYFLAFSHAEALSLLVTYENEEVQTIAECIQKGTYERIAL